MRNDISLHFKRNLLSVQREYGAQDWGEREQECIVSNTQKYFLKHGGAAG